MNEVTMTIWGREFNLKVDFDVYGGEEVSALQNAALSEFVSNVSSLDATLPSVKAYCLKMNGEDVGAAAIDNIFKYVIPQSIYVPKWPDGSRMIGLMCAYKFNREDGLAVVFKNGQFHEIGTQNIIL